MPLTRRCRGIGSGIVVDRLPLGGSSLAARKWSRCAIVNFPACWPPRDGERVRARRRQPQQRKQSMRWKTKYISGFYNEYDIPLLYFLYLSYILYRLYLHHQGFYCFHVSYQTKRYHYVDSGFWRKKSLQQSKAYYTYIHPLHRVFGQLGLSHFFLYIFHTVFPFISCISVDADIVSSFCCCIFLLLLLVARQPAVIIMIVQWSMEDGNLATLWSYRAMSMG